MLGQFNEQFELNEEEKEILERLIKQAQFDDDANEAFCLMIDMEYAKKKVTEYIEMEDDYANYANEYFEGLNAEFEEKSSKRAKNIIDNLTWADTQEELHSLLPNATDVTYEGVPNDIPSFVPQETAHSVHEFFKTIK